MNAQNDATPAYWHFSDDYSRAWVATSDPRVVAVIERQNLAEAPDYDAQAPTLIGYEYGSRASFTHIGASDPRYMPERAAEIAARDAWLDARDRAPYGTDAEDFADRFVKIFYGVMAVHLHSSIHRYSWAVVFIPADSDTQAELDFTAEVVAYLDDEVYGIGYAFNPARVTDETELPDDPTTNPDWETVIECWGFYGEHYAKNAALAFEYGAPTLPEMLELATA